MDPNNNIKAYNQISYKLQDDNLQFEFPDSATDQAQSKGCELKSK